MLFSMLFLQMPVLKASESSFAFDIDGDGEIKPLTDGLLLLRYQFGFRGNALIDGAVGNGATRATADQIESYIREHSTKPIPLSGLIVGKTLYHHCVSGIKTFEFKNNGELVMVQPDSDTWTTSYRVSGSVLFVVEDNNIENSHPVVQQTDDFITFSDEEEGSSTTSFYYLRSVAETSPAKNCDDGSGGASIDYQIDDGIADTKISFKDADNNNIVVPDDAWVRIIPKSYADANNYSMSIRCKIQSDGSFENNCLINEGGKNDLDRVLALDSERYQIVIFKNHINSSNNDWDCGEDVYSFAGDNEADWSNIEVRPEHYRDESGASCNGGNNGPIDYQIDDGIADTKISFKDADNNDIAVPDDAWVRVTPKSYADVDNYSMSIHCKVQSDGSFENSCFIFEDQKNDFDRVLAIDNELYQVYVFKNHINPTDIHSNCGEDLYRSLGGDESNWSNIEIRPEHYQDRSGEVC